MSTLAETQYCSASSSFDPFFYEEETIRIQYENGSGRVTWRKIKIIRVYNGRNGYTYIRAYCFLRQEERTFRADRVLDWTEEEDEPVMRRDYARPTYTQSYPRPEPPRRDYIYQPVQPTARQAGNTISTEPKAEPFSSKAEEPAAEVPGKSGKKGGAILAGIVSTIITILLVAVISSIFDDESSSYSHTAAMRQEEQRIEIMKMVEEMEKKMEEEEEAAAAKVQPKPEPPEVTITFREYRGYDIRVKTADGVSSYTVEAAGAVFSTLRDAHTAINAKEFIAATAIRDDRVLAMYAGADSDRNGHLSWKEIEEFQKWLDRTFKYTSNDIALRPDQFLDSNGGDCEDWALVTCGLLRFWGWNCQVASFAPSAYANGHAITLVWSREEPSCYRYYFYPEEFIMTGRTQRAGYYIPIDYQFVGDISNAMGEEWFMRNLWVPEEIYGKAM